ncbi:uncharacterized protein LOC143433565 [Xylocopa sonorina]|uniref:uncharacterized protein LOC143433565 n=1 Tax=Xylocopa sonorina TaxID=1818115 RepID=UPI00403B0EEF
MVLKYNYFFYANVCHVCKRFGNGITLKRCSNCTMISYCCKEHQRIHWSQHKDLCNVVCNILRNNKTLISLSNGQNIAMENWAQMKMNLMLLVMIKIGRKLEHYEEQMFKFLRSCIVCHDQNINALVNCPNCPNASFCAKHKDDTVHTKFCSLINLCFNLDVITITHKRKLPEIKLLYHTDIINLPQSMKDFIDLYIEPQTDSQISAQEETIINAEYLSRPLTFLYAMQKLEYPLKDDSIIINIIAANIVDIDSLELWEILLHWIAGIKTLNIFLIGPELYSSSMQMTLCRSCQEKNKQLLIQIYGMLYENYIEIYSHTKPNFIIGYNAGIHECEDFESKNDTWRRSLQMIAEQNSPLILTSYTLTEAKKDRIRLNEVLNKRVKHIYFGQNPYSSLRPYRDFETEGIYYQNQFIIIYKHLKALQ